MSDEKQGWADEVAHRLVWGAPLNTVEARIAQRLRDEREACAREGQMAARVGGCTEPAAEYVLNRIRTRTDQEGK